MWPSLFILGGGVSKNGDRFIPRLTARTPVVLYALDREDFLAAVTSHEPSAEAAEGVVSARLAGIPVGGTRIPTV